MLNSFTVANASLDAEVTLRSDPDSTFGTWISVLIGKNGSRKSYFLRQILEAALGRGAGADASRRKLDISPSGWESSVPQSLICISGTPLDRFPRTRNMALGVQKKNEGKRFLYLGQRATNGMAGISQSQRTLMAALFLNSDPSGNRKHLFESVFNSIGFRAELGISLRLGKTLLSHYKTWLSARVHIQHMAKDVIEDYAEKIVSEYLESTPIEEHAPRISAVLMRIAHFDFQINGIFKLLRWFNSESERPALRFEDGVIGCVTNPWHDWGLDELETFIRVGLIEVDKVTFLKRNVNSHSSSPSNTVTGDDIQLSGEDLSSGQWGWIAGFAGLCAHIDKNSLVLVDEPENSLHPIWQQKYVPILNSILREFRGSQAIVVTHSPMIASGVDPEWGRVEALIDHGVNEKGQQVVRSEPAGSTFGWRASDVYEEAFGLTSSRAPSFTRMADLALALIRSRKTIGSDEYDVFKRELSLDLKSLPLADPLRNVLASIIKDLESRFIARENN
ncbi:AAA family ATPase [Pseudomonas salomonii]|jgi:hypothetical protein|uniref:AAA family ATPase n=1 Tax=Pseudomonas salomonii TaxID=191391 RepID=A0ABS9GI69_9PSED|nr:AAA family ATPase [Pseudomonas salomonii]MCF5545438.1 AAA family ATPase [Pseudomonas salomonii]